jgi:UDP-glucose 6-dehydrogenase
MAHGRGSLGIVCDCEPALVLRYAICRDQARKARPDIEYCDPRKYVGGADALVIVADWVQLSALDLDRIKRAMVRPFVVDHRNIYCSEELAEAGFA